MSKKFLISIMALIAFNSQAARLDSREDSLLGGRIFVNETGSVEATFLSKGDAGYTNVLFLHDPSNSLGLLFNNQTTSVGTMVSLGTFDAGTELIFRMRVTDTGDDFFTGSRFSNPDKIAHALADRNAVNHITRVGFEDQLGGGDFNYNDLVFSLSNTLVVPVPEPAQWLLLALGLGVVLRAKSRQPVKTNMHIEPQA